MQLHITVILRHLSLSILNLIMLLFSAETNVASFLHLMVFICKCPTIIFQNAPFVEIFITSKVTFKKLVQFVSDGNLR